MTLLDNRKGIWPVKISLEQSEDISPKSFGGGDF